MVKSVLIFTVIVVALFSCSENKGKEAVREVNNAGNAATETKGTDTAMVQQEAEYVIPYKYIETVTNEDRYTWNELIIFACGKHPNLDTLKAVCVEMKKRMTGGGTFHRVAFVDDAKEIQIPDVPWISDMDDNQLRHVMAQYTYNYGNGFSELLYYKKNAFESPPIIVKIQ